MEHVEQLHRVKKRQIGVKNVFLARFKRRITAAAQHHLLYCQLPSTTAACGLHALIDGLMQTWPLIQRAFELETTGSLEW